MTRLGLGLRKQQGLGLSPKSGAAPSPPYVAKAVKFDGTQVLDRDGSFGLSDTTKMTTSFWIRAEDWVTANNDYLYKFVGSTPGAGYLFPLNSGSAHSGLFWQLLDGDLNVRTQIKTDSSYMDVDIWYNVLASFDFTLGILCGVYISDVQQIPLVELSTLPYTIPWAAADYGAVGASDADDPSTVADFADWQIYPGVSIVQSDGTINEVDRRNFINASGKPVDPAVAVAAYGTPPFLFSGDASTFATNLGTGGAFTLTGTLTNASTSPSD